MAKTNPKLAGRNRRKLHIRKRVRGTTSRPRLCVFRSAKHIYAQVIDDEKGVTIVSATSLSAKNGGNRDGAAEVGTAIAKAAVAANVKSIVFDRNGYLYHGRIAALAEAAREAGLEF